jgi:AcrR family transcriptional regulator
MIAPTSSSPTEPAQLGLRERKKLRTRTEIRTQAMRLFEEVGYAATTVEQIAAAAEVSPSTFFRYFPTKERLVLTDDLDPVLIRSLAAQPNDLSPLAAIRAAIEQTLTSLSPAEAAWELQRRTLMRTVPELRTAMYDELSRTVQMLTDALADRLGRPRDDFELTVTAGAAVGVALSVMGRDTDGDYSRILDGLRFLEAGLPVTVTPVSSPDG